MGAGGSNVRYGVRRYPFTSNCLPDLKSKMSMDQPLNNHRATYGLSHRERSSQERDYVGVLEPDLIVDFKGSSSDVSVMKGLRLFFLNCRVLVHVVS